MCYLRTFLIVKIIGRYWLIKECGTLVKWQCQRKLKYMEKNWSCGHIVNHKSHTEWPGAEPGSPWCETGDYLSHGTDKWNKQKEERTSSHYLSIWTEYFVSSSTNSMQRPWSRKKLLPLSTLCISVWNSSAW